MEICQNCPIVNCVVCKLSGIGTGTNGIMFVKNYPEHTDILSKQPFTGASGSEFNKFIKIVGIDKEQSYLTNLVKCRVLDTRGEGGTVKKEVSNFCSNLYLKDEIEKICPKVIVAFGDSVLQHFFPTYKISAYRGQVLFSEKYNCIVIPTYDTASAVKTSKYDPLIIRDLRLAKSIAEGTYQKKNNFKHVTIDTLDLLLDLKEKLKSVEYAAIDVETHRNNFKTGTLISIAFSWKKDTGVCIPLHIWDKEYPVEIPEGTKNREKFVEKYRISNPIPKAFWGDKQEQVLSIIKEILALPFLKIGHNFYYDMMFLKQAGMEVNNYTDDTIIMYSLINEEAKKDLDSLSFIYTDKGGYKAMIKPYRPNDDSSFLLIPLEVLTLYNSMDAAVTLELYLIFKEELEKQNLMKLYTRISMPMQHIFINVSYEGILVDKDLLLTMQKEYEDKINYILLKFTDYLIPYYGRDVVIINNVEQKKKKGIKYFNVNSSTDLSDFIFKKLKLKVIKQSGKSGRASLDEQVLHKYLDKHDFIKLLIEYRQITKVKSTYIDSLLESLDENNRIHTEYKIWGTETGRLCLAKGTFIDAVRDSSKYPKGIPIEDVKIGDLVYCYDDDLNLTLDKVKWVGCTGNKKCLKINWVGQGNKYIGNLICTPEHRIRMIDGTYKEAQELKPKDRILALSRGLTNYGYNRLFSKNKEIKEHRFIYSKIYNKTSETIHHIDGNKLNNTPSNLQGMTNNEHSKYHAKKDIIGIRLDKFIKAGREALKFVKPKYGKDNPVYIKVSRFTLLRDLAEGGGRPTKRRKTLKDFDTFKRKCRDNNINIKDVSMRYSSVGYLSKKKLLQTVGHPRGYKLLNIGFYRYKKLLNYYNIDINHRVISVEYIDMPLDVYDIETENHHNFIANELCVHNSSKDPNLQNQPPVIRKVFIASPGHVFIEADMSQHELRCLAGESGDPALMKIYKEGKDLHTETACSIFNITPDKMEPWHRKVAKGVNFGIPYGISPKGLQEDLANSDIKISEQEAQDYINKWYKKYSTAWGYLKNSVRSFFINRELVTKFKRKRRYVKVFDDKKVVAGIEREVQNFCIQSVASDIVSYLTIKLHPLFEAEGIKIRLTVHDSLLLEVPENKVEVVKKILKENTYLVWPEFNNVPFMTEAKIGKSWGVTEKLSYD